MRLGLGAIGPWLPLLRDPDFEPIVAKIVGVGTIAFVERLAGLQSYLPDLGEEAVSLLECR